MFRIVFSAATVFAAWIAMVAKGWNENPWVEDVMQWHIPGTSIAWAFVVAFIIVYRFTFVITHKRRNCGN